MGGQLGTGMVDGWDGAGGDKDPNAHADAATLRTGKVLEDIWSSPQGGESFARPGPPPHPKGLLVLITSKKFQTHLFVSQTDTRSAILCPHSAPMSPQRVYGMWWLQASLFTMATLIHFHASRDLLPWSTGWPTPRGTEATPVTTSGQGNGAQ